MYRSPPATLAVRAALACAALGLSGCFEIDGRPPAEQPMAGSRLRTVDIELVRTAERRMVLDADGLASYPASEPLGGVEICVVEQRPAFDSFGAFEQLDFPLCAISEPDETTRVRGLPADADLLLTYVKPGYRSVLTTFRTDDHDVDVPSWANNATYFMPMLREDDELPVEPEAEPLGAHGLVAVWVEAVGEYTVGDGVAQLNAEADHGVAPAEGVTVTIEDADANDVQALSTRRDRPHFLSLRSGESYRARFQHPALELVPLGVQEQFMITGLPTARLDAIEVPVRAGYLTLAMVDGFCPLPSDPERGFADLATCTLEP